MVATVEELLPILKELIAKQKTLEDELVELKKSNTLLKREKSRGILHSMTPQVRAMIEDEELLSSPILNKCIDLIIASNKDRV